MSWKRSSGGTSIVSTSARWMASPIRRRSSAGLPLASEMRTSGMADVRTRNGTGNDVGKQPAEALRARAAGGELERKPRLRIGAVLLGRDSHGRLLHANDTAAAPPRAFLSARPPLRSR